MSGTEVGRGEGGTGEAITARLDEIEATARKATQGHWKPWGMQVLADQDGTSNVDTARPVCSTYYRNEEGRRRTFDADHIALNDPAAVLAMVAGLRAVVALCGDNAIYADFGEPPDEHVVPGVQEADLLTAVAAMLPDPSPAAPSEGAAGTEVGADG